MGYAAVVVNRGASRCAGRWSIPPGGRRICKISYSMTVRLHDRLNRQLNRRDPCDETGGPVAEQHTRITPFEVKTVLRAVAGTAMVQGASDGA